VHKPRKNIDLVIPFSNENLNLQILIPAILKTIKKISKIKFRLIFIDDGSNDRGHVVVLKYKKRYKNIILLRNLKRRGQTFCYKTYLNKFNTNSFIRMDSDNQDNPVYLMKMSQYINSGYEMILTDRKLRKHSTLMIILTYLYDFLLKLLVKKKLETYSSSLAYFNTKYLYKRNLKFNDHRYFPIIALHSGVKKIKVFPVMHNKRKYGVTKYKIYNKIFFAVPEFLYFFYRLKRGFLTN